MEYMTTGEAAKKWGISARRVLCLASGNKIPGAKQIEKRWMIPAAAEKPADGRTRLGKNQQAAFYRYPCFEFKEEKSFTPPLDREELILKASTEAFHECRFNDADISLGNLYETSGNRYHRISALYTKCMIDIALCKKDEFHNHYERLAMELQDDFPHKAEMIEYIHMIDSTLGYNKYYADEFQIDSTYNYSDEFIPRLKNLASVSLIFAESRFSIADLRTHELSCMSLENSDSYSDLQSLHMYLGIAYGLIDQKEKSYTHLKRSIELAEEYNLYFNLMTQYQYTPKLFKPVLKEFPKAFSKKLNKLSKYAHKQLAGFMNEMPSFSLYSMLSSNDYIFVHYAMRGLTNKEIAGLMNISVGGVGKKYSEIYASLGVKSKGEMLRLCNSEFTNPLHAE